MENPDFYDLRSLMTIRGALERLDPRGPAKALVVDPILDPDVKRIGILSGSFDPPTVAHVELAARARNAFRLDRVVFLVSRITIDKEEARGLTLEDRLLLLSFLAGEQGCASVAIANRGLYFEQAGAIRAMVGNRTKIFFIVGMDKVTQILDPRYYENREAALLQLFVDAQLIAASRGAFGERELRDLIDRKENENFADRIYFLPMPDATHQTASSDIREAIVRGQIPREQLPEAVSRFVAETGAYGPAYALRRFLLEKLYAAREWAEGNANLRELLILARQHTDEGRALKELIEDPSKSICELKEFIAARRT